MFNNYKSRLILISILCGIACYYLLPSYAKYIKTSNFDLVFTSPDKNTYIPAGTGLLLTFDSSVNEDCLSNFKFLSIGNPKNESSDNAEELLIDNLSDNLNLTLDDSNEELLNDLTINWSDVPITDNENNIRIDEIRSIINFSGEYQSDTFVNECLCGNILQYKKILSELYSNVVNHIFLLRILANKTHRLLKMKEMESNYNNLENLLSSSKPPIFWKEKPMVKKQLTIWSLNALKSTIQEINEIELLCKKNPQISKIIFFNFFTQICTKAKNYS